ncbi:MAG: NADPH:quinone reductase-like Zn-dependent oxidoreductase [Polaribacter sp.]|jgi:NADPH:quinone reductase-like Zn-dependent oxidoreductase
MKVISIKSPGGLDHLQVSEKETPKPDTGEVLVLWRATSLNYHDYLVAMGLIPVPDGRIPMSDGAGEIIGLGEGVTEWKMGDKVMSMFFPNWIEGKPSAAKTTAIMGESVDGCMTEMSCYKSTDLTAIPNGYSFAEAATLPCACTTAWRGLFVEGNLQAGQKVLIEGTGGMSIFALQLAKAAGARVFATTSSAEKADRLMAMGAEAVVNYKEDERWGKTIFKMTGGGVDHVLDVGGGSTMVNSIEAAAIGGHIASIGILGGGRKGTITFPKLFFKHLQITGLAVGSRAMQMDMVNAINVSNMKPVIDQEFAFEELGAAFEYQASGKHFGKIVVTI